MKKFFSIILALCFVFCLAGCGDKDNASSTPSAGQPVPPANDAASVVPEGEAVSALPGNIPQSFLLTSATNLWKTELTLKPDGSFSGLYTEQVDERSEIDGYPNGKVLICEFTGKFDNIMKINDYTYAMKLADLDNSWENDNYWIEDGVLYETSEAMGIFGGEWFYLYLPGCPTIDLDKAFTMWYLKSENIPVTLDMYGLYNPTQRYAFFG